MAVCHYWRAVLAEPGAVFYSAKASQSRQAALGPLYLEGAFWDELNVPTDKGTKIERRQ